MITVEDLKAFDLQVWLRSGEEAAQRLFIAQSTVSRRNAETQKLFGIKLFRDPLGEWAIRGDTTLLNLERRVHQLYRLSNTSEKLRLEATFWAGPTLAQPAPDGWENGAWDHFGLNRPLSLLKDRVIDAWIGSYQPDLPEIDNPDFCVIDLCQTLVNWWRIRITHSPGKAIFHSKISKPSRPWPYPKAGSPRPKRFFARTGCGQRRHA